MSSCNCKCSYVIIFLSCTYRTTFSSHCIYAMIKKICGDRNVDNDNPSNSGLKKQDLKCGLSCDVFTADLLTTVQVFNIHYWYLQENGFCKLIALGEPTTTFTLVKEQIMLPETLKQVFFSHCLACICRSLWLIFMHRCTCTYYL